MSYIVTDDCVLCGACIAGCESHAISEGATKAQIDTTICIECGTCASNCPSGAIKFIVDSAVKGDSPNSASTKMS